MSKEQPHHTVEVSSGDQHRIDTPPEQHDALRVDETDTRTFFEKLCAHATVAAAGLDRPGYLNLSGLRPSSKNLRLIGRFKPEDIDGLTAAAVAEARSGSNVYVEGRLVSPDAPKGARGNFEYTVSAFAFVIDADADKGKEGVWPIAPSLRTETSPGNYHCWFFSKAGIEPAKAKQIGEELRRIARADHDTGVIAQPYRVPGTPNYVSDIKKSRGRQNSNTRIVESGPSYTPEELERAFCQTSLITPRKLSEPDAPTITKSAPDLLRRYGPVIRQHLEAELARTQCPDRSVGFHALVATLKRYGYSTAEIAILMNAYPDSCWNEKYEGRLEAEIERSWNKISIDEGAYVNKYSDHISIDQTSFSHNPRKEKKSGPSNVLDGRWDQLDFANTVIDDIGRHNILAAKSGTWVWTDKGVWKKSDQNTIKKRIHQSLSERGHKVTASLVNNVAQLITTEIYVDNHMFNLGNPETVNCLNGELELIDGVWSLRKHRRELFRTTQIPVAYDPDATSPRWHQFLDEVFRGDPDAAEKKKALFELIGYTLMSHARHEKFVILVGAGANGKSVLLATLQALLGLENVAAVQPSNFDRPFQRAHLNQKLANIITEIAQGELLADAELKAITSGDPSTVEQKYGDPFVMYPFATCWFGTNHMPRSKDFSEALFRRAVIIPFNRVFDRSEQDPMLKEKLLEELPGILKLSLEAYAAARVYGFTEPASSTTAKQEWRKEIDQVAQFVDECCQSDPAAEVSFSDLFRAYSRWAADEQVRLPMTKKGFRERLSRLGYGERRDRHTRFVTGLKIVQTLADPHDFG